MLKRFWNRGTKQKIILILVGLILFCALFILRDDYQPFLLFLRKYLFVLLVFGAILYFGIRSFRRTVRNQSHRRESRHAANQRSCREGQARAVQLRGNRHQSAIPGIE